MFEFSLKKFNLLVSLITTFYYNFSVLNKLTLIKKIKKIEYKCIIVFIKFTRRIFMDQINNTTIITTISIEINIIKLY